MASWLQHVLVIALVATCVAAVGRQLVATLRLGKGGKLGSCCAKGCEAEHAAATGPKERIVFIPSASLVRRK